MDFWIERSRVRDESTLRVAASTLLRGCKYHFDKSVTRVSRIARIVSPERTSDFKNRVQALQDASTDDDFRVLVKTLLECYPAAKPWLDWWIRHSHATMIFPSQRTMDDKLWNSLPSTTNAEESIHNTLRIATGNRHELLPGLRALHAFAVWGEQTVVAAKGIYFSIVEFSLTS